MSSIASRLAVVFLLCTTACSVVSIPGIPQLSTPQGDCSKYTWRGCPPGYGMTNSSDWKNCCGSYPSYCPVGFDECTANAGCCQSGFPYYCATSAGNYCCTSGYAICGPDKQCLTGGCLCTGCVGPNPCKFGISCQDCQSCCASYIQTKLCSGWACSGGQVAVRNFAANVSCPAN